MKDIKNYETFVKIEPIYKGLSGDKKYYVETANGEKLLLRIAGIEEYERKKAEYDKLNRASSLGIRLSSPVDFGFCDGGKSVYLLLAWCEGEDAEELLPKLSESERSSLGLKASGILKKMHTLPAPENAEAWGIRFRGKIQGRIDFYNAHSLKCENGDLIVDYLQKNQYLLDERPQTFNHGDFNISNLIVSPDGEIAVIDFNYFNLGYGDPWWEICSLIWGKEIDAYFYTGMFNGYCNGRPSENFFQMQTYYFAYDALAALCDTSEYDGGEPEDGRQHMENILRWFNNMRNYMPSWYVQKR